MGAQTMHDGLFKTGHAGKLRIDMQIENVSGKTVDQGLIFRGLRINDKIRVPIGKYKFLFGGVLAAKPAIKS